MSNFSVTQSSTARGRGRPVGTGYAAVDRLLIPEIEAILKPTPQVATLRDAVRPIEPRLVGGGEGLSRIRRFERLYRAEVST